MSLKKTLGCIGSANFFVMADISLFRLNTETAFKIFCIAMVLFIAMLLGLKQVTGLIEVLKAKYGASTSTPSN